jgi:hypothetical protein
MTDALELELRAAMTERSQRAPVAEVVERLQQLEYPQTWRRVPLPLRVRLWPILSTAGVALVAVIAAVILTASPATPVAYAGWTPVPTTPSPAQLAKATASCKFSHSLSRSGSPTLSGKPVLTDQRGKFTAAIYVIGTYVDDCLSDGNNDGGTSLSGNAIQLTSYARPGPDQLGLPVGSGATLKGFLGGNPKEPLPPQWQRLLNSRFVKDHPGMRARLEAAFRADLAGGIETNEGGLAGRDIATVTFVFADGTTVDATVHNGWYFAWWPSPYSPTSVRVTTTSGAHTSCSARRNTGCVWAGFKRRPLRGAPTTTTPAVTTPAGKLLTPSQVQTPIAFHVTRADRFCTSASSSAPYMGHIVACDKRIPSGYHVFPPGWSEGRPEDVYVTFTFKARVAVTNRQSQYEWTLVSPGNTGGSGGQTNKNLHVGQTVSYADFMPSERGIYHIAIAYTQDTEGAQSPATNSLYLHVRSGTPLPPGTVIVGTFSFREPPTT